MKFDALIEYERDFKKLLKKYKSLNDDIHVVKQILNVYPDERAPFSFRISDLKIDSCIIKVKKIACKSLKGKGVNSGLRLVYAYFEEEERISFIELYHKSNKASADRKRILKYFK